MSNPNQVWIELEKPKSPVHATEQCRLANKMIRKLGISDQIGFSYFEKHNCYLFGAEDRGFKELTDNGTWPA